MKKIKYLFLILSYIGIVTSCEKFLDERPNSSLALLRTVSDFQAIMDNELGYNDSFPFAADYASDYYYLTDANWSALAEITRDNYLWGNEPPHSNNWNQAYSAKIYPANVVIEGIDNADLGKLTEEDRRRVKGTAFFSRGYIFYHLAQLFAPPYVEEKATFLLGIPIRKLADINAKTERANLKDTYESILGDLKSAADLLPDLPAERNRPSKAAAFAALSRVYLVMRDFEKSSLYADSCLMLYDHLIDYNSLDSSSNQSQFPILNSEVIFHGRRTNTSSSLGSSRANVDTVLYSKYHYNDLRRSMYYKTNNSGVRGFYADYGGDIVSSSFIGLATDEVYLTSAESKIRNGDIIGGLKMMNDLLITRYKTGKFIPFNTDSKEEALKLVISEREKELAFRSGIRWADLRRLNLEPAFAKTIYRRIRGELYPLEPNGKRYTFKIPYQVIEMTGIEQNE